MFAVHGSPHMIIINGNIQDFESIKKSNFMNIFSWKEGNMHIICKEIGME